MSLSNLVCDPARSIDIDIGTVVQVDKCARDKVARREGDEFHVL